MTKNRQSVRDTGIVIVYITTGSLKEAEEIGRSLVESRLAACVNIVPRIFSVYRWKERIETGEETLVFAKTVREKAEAVISKIKEIHSYEVPCIEVIEIKEGFKEYVKFVQEEVS